MVKKESFFFFFSPSRGNRACFLLHRRRNVPKSPAFPPCYAGEVASPPPFGLTFHPFPGSRLRSSFSEPFSLSLSFWMTKRVAAHTSFFSLIPLRCGGGREIYPHFPPFHWASPSHKRKKLEALFPSQHFPFSYRRRTSPFPPFLLLRPVCLFSFDNGAGFKIFPFLFPPPPLLFHGCAALGPFPPFRFGSNGVFFFFVVKSR